jgi:hypothetical protein
LVWAEKRRHSAPIFRNGALRSMKIDLLEAADFASDAAEAKWRPRASDSRRDWKMEVR